MTNDRWDLVGIEREYVHGNMSLERIGTAFSLSTTTLRKFAKERGWVRLVGTKPLPHGPRPRPRGVPRPKRPTVAEKRRQEMVSRLLDALDKGLTELEARMTTDGEGSGVLRSAAEAERDARTLTGLARLYAKLVELDEQAKEIGKGAQAPTDQGSGAKEATDDADRFRRELALRLQRLNQARDA